MKAILRDDGYIGLTFDYDKRTVEKVKQVFNDRRWRPDRKHWKIPLKELETLEEEFPQANVTKNLENEYKMTFDEEYRKQNIPDIEVKGFNGELYDFQKTGVNKMVNKGRLLLGDEMGTGKTIHSIATALKLKETKNINDFLIICPASLKQQWKKEIEKFTDKKVTLIDGKPDERSEKWQEDSFFYIMNYALLLNDEEPFQKEWGGVVLDEATYIKNPEAKRTQKVKQIKAKHKYGLSGTPVENTAEDIFSIVDFIDEDIFGNYWNFRDNYLQTQQNGYGGRSWTEIVGYKNLDDLYRNLKPIYLRRTKDEVLSDLPEKTETVRTVNLTMKQRTAYNQYKQIVYDKLEVEEHFMGEVIMARMVCDHTELVNKSEADSSRHDNLSSSSSKMNELEEIRDEVYANNNKMLVFTNFKKMANIIQKEEENVYKVTGDTKDKEKILNEFKNDEEPAMLVATDAIQYGVNLQEANTVVHFDSPFNPSKIKQRNDRVHRLGQEKPVTVIKLIAENTIEERVEKILEQKEDLSDAIVEGKGGMQLDAELTARII